MFLCGDEGVRSGYWFVVMFEVWSPFSIIMVWLSARLRDKIDELARFALA